MSAFHHGVEVHETTKLSTLIRDIETAVIGVVCTAEDADPEIFPLDTPVLITRVNTAIAGAGKTGTLYTTLKAISDQCSPKVIVVRVAQAKAGSEKTQDQLVIGGSGDNGRYTGLYSLLTAEANLGERPRVLAVPGLDTKPVAMQLAIFAEQIKAFAYVGANGCKTIAEAKKYREDFSQREIMIIYPDVIAYNSQSGKSETVPATAYAVGLRARIDAEQGWHKSISNVPLNGILGLSADIYWTLQGKDTDADDLNSKQITTLIKRDGFRIWGNRSCDTETYTFEVYTRTAQILAEMIAEAHFSYIDKTLTPSLIKDIVDGINRKGSQLVTQGKLLGFQCWYDPTDNPKEQIREGKSHVRYKYTPVPPLENLTLTQEFTDEYFETAFSQLG